MMNSSSDLFFKIPLKPVFYSECLDRAVCLHLDRMPDHSWRRYSSDQPYSWFMAHLDRANTPFLVVRQHTLAEQNERWGKNKHLEVYFELREASTTYIFSLEMDFGYLDYLVEKYRLTTTSVHY